MGRRSAAFLALLVLCSASTGLSLRHAWRGRAAGGGSRVRVACEPEDAEPQEPLGAAPKPRIEPPPRGFGMKVRALRGEYSPEDGESDTEDDSNLLAAIGGFPNTYRFTAVGSGDGFVEEVVSLVEGTLDGQRISEGDVVVTDRMGGKFKSVQVSGFVEGPEEVAAVFAALSASPRVKMQF